MATIHSATRAYVFGCEYNSSDWLDDPSTFISDLQTALSGISNFSYARLLVSNVRNASRKEIEVEIDGIIYDSKTKLTSTEADSLLTDLTDAMDTITDLIYGYINIVADVFREDATSGWPGQSFEEE